MSFAKFMSLVYSQALHFTRIDQLEDRFEGAKPVQNLRDPGQLSEYAVFGDTSQMSEDQKRQLALAMVAPHPLDRLVVAVNCWHMNEGESSAMWPLYVQRREGVVIQSTVARLRRAFDPTPQEVIIGAVRYIDHSTDSIPRGNFLQAFLHKRKCFEHERELRALVFLPRNSEGELTVVPENGIDIAVDLHALIEKIHLAPSSPSWFEATVCTALRGVGYGDLKVQRSELDAEPPN